MCIQFEDTVFYHCEKYVLIDNEIGHNLIDSAEFFPKEIEKRNGLYLNTACHRGYIADYIIWDDRIYGQKTIINIYHEKKEMILENPNYHFIHKWDNLISEVKPLDYTGSIVIVKDDCFPSDFLDNYLDASSAYEMYFKHGRMVEVRNLRDAIEEFKNSDLQYGKEYRNKRVNIARKYLKYQYGEKTYR